MASTSKSGESSGSSRIVQVGESLYELNQPVGKPTIQVLFFHGLLLEGDYSRAHWSTWQSEDGACCWPQTWLVDELPGAHVFSVSCSGCLGKSSTECLDLFRQAENLISDVLTANIGQDPRCPVVLVGHSIGGLVIKELCCQVYHKVGTSRGVDKTRVENFLNSLRGIFYYATPHRGSPIAEQLADIIGSPLLKYFKTLSTETARLNDEFDHMCKLYDKCQFANLGESRPTKLGLLGDVMVVPEAAARGENFNVVEQADHFSICRPKNKISRGFQKLKTFLADRIADGIKEQSEVSHPDNFQRLPKKITGINVQLQEVKSKLKNVNSLGLVGMGGLGKTTLAMALFNNLSVDFEYTCFVLCVKEGVGSVEKQVWNNMYYLGKKFGNGVPEWSKLRDKRVLVVLDDIARACDVTGLLYDTSSESRLIVTSRERDLLERSVDDVHDVQFLGKENARCLFMSHAFPSQEMAPDKYTDLMDAILKKCEGLPLTLEVFGQYLQRKQNVVDWEQTLNALDKADTVKSFNERLWEKLRVSYDGLEDMEQKMLLDATTFFCRSWYWTLRDAKAAWTEAYDTDSVNLLWQTLVDMSLVYQIEDDESIKVHEQLQSLGRKIAADSNNQYQRRVWDHETILELLQNRVEFQDANVEFQDANAEFQVDKDIEEWLFGGKALGVCHEVCQSRIHKSCPFLHKLKHPEAEDPVTIGRPQETKSFLSTVFPLERFGFHCLFPSLPSRLVFLKLNCSRMQSLPSSIAQLLALRALILYVHSDYEDTMTHVPDEIGLLPRLKVLEFDGFRSLQKLPETLGQLSQLTDLRLKACTSLGALPDSLGHLSMLQRLELNSCRKLQSRPLRYLAQLNSPMHYEFGNIERLPESLAGLMNLSHLEISGLPLRTVPDLTNLRSLHSLKLGVLPYVKDLPPWLEDIGVTFSALSRTFFTFEKRGGRFTLIRGKDFKFRSSDLVEWLHGRAMEKVKGSDYKGAVGELCANLGGLDPDDRGFLLREKGIAKRVAGDLHGAQEDLVAALAIFGEVIAGQGHVYNCRKHLGYVKFLLGDVDGAREDGEIALGLGRLGGDSQVFPCLGEEPIKYLHFKLKGSERYEEGEMSSSHARVMEKVRAADFTTALAIWEEFDARVLGYHNQQYFLQERGVLKRLAGNWNGSLEDLTKSLEILPHHYPCLKHRAYVNFLLGNLEEARMDANECTNHEYLRYFISSAVPDQSGLVLRDIFPNVRICLRLLRRKIISGILGACHYLCRQGCRYPCQ